MEAEIEGAQSWADRHAVALEWIGAALELRATLRQPGTGMLFFLLGKFAEYKALPPAWTFAGEEWLVTGRPAFPKPTQTPFGSSIFVLSNQNPVICAPFNRLAFADQGGPHADWGGAANWLVAGPSQIHAETVGEMLQAVHRDLSYTRGRMDS